MGRGSAGRTLLKMKYETKLDVNMPWAGKRTGSEGIEPNRPRFYLRQIVGRNDPGVANFEVATSKLLVGFKCRPSAGPFSLCLKKKTEKTKEGGCC